MRRLPSSLCALLLVGAAYLSVASLSWEDDPPSDPPPQVVVEPAQPRVDETWVVENLFDGQTAVPPSHTIRLALGRRDFEDGDEWSLGEVQLTRADTGDPVPFNVSIDWASTRISPLGGFAPDTDYELDVSWVRHWIFAERVLPPGPIWFSTRSAPRVTGLWRSGETLIVAFSEAMDPERLALGLAGVNVLWEEGGALRSLAGDLNLAAFAWQTESYLFLMGSIAFADALGPVWVQVSGTAAGVSGASLDGDGDGVPGEPEDDFFEEVVTSELPTCFTREDLPTPCVREQDVPDLFDDPAGWW